MKNESTNILTANNYKTNKILYSINDKELFDTKIIIMCIFYAEISLKHKKPFETKTYLIVLINHPYNLLIIEHNRSICSN